MTPLRVAVVGCGPWGLVVLDTLLGRWRRTGSSLPPLEVTVVDPAADPGGGLYAQTPEHLLLNTPAGDVDIFGRPGPRPARARTFLEFVRARGYRVDEPDGPRSPGPDDYLPRAWLGDYLGWACTTLTSDLPDRVRVTHARTHVTRLDPGRDGVELTCSDGERRRADFAFVTVGVPAPRPQEVRPGPGETVVVAGMGLTAIDAVVSLTVGRGGRFEPAGEPGRLVYRPSGDEPVIHQFSRSGFFPLGRPAARLDTLAGWDATLPLAAAPEGSRSVDFRATVLPALLAKMAEAELWPDRTRAVQHAASPAVLSAAVDAPRATFASAQQYGSAVHDALAADVDECAHPTLPARRRGVESLKLLRDDVRRLCDFDRLTPESHAWFLRSVLPLFYRFTVGPPASRGRELLALREAGVLRHDLGPAPAVTAAGAGAVVTSTSLHTPTTVVTDHCVPGHLPAPTVDTLPAFLADGVRSGHVVLRRAGGREVGIAVDSRFHPIGPAGPLTTKVAYLGALTEGSRHFNFYVPSPGVRARAYLDAERCVDVLLDGLLVQAAGA
ncbi:FAD/NAD(P)-binding protein [Cellulomonas fimi]|uniref:FAD-dependent urate hydroxylase HpyO/Asp monooxygenase CreE-like FAD/NAD(P)-binding domain-containing protein n=1 Tax=Cellulomonas fimi (strain ATCC 484 / DSM 20113 / JCM 1341 / CCUG 24087 / LMG 16345 / NBRC 15513 / NCIMB 8980 / NCTC 7547 / NRS-133) TaxID=590998 RepID=F4H3Z3_CELFA|nr:FAD/NAD(P)-binding protein [Cellulomonas fimi]AEE44217.1 hypothetical protein Celf_0066 [Cellulomonas fimi ATCC 484]NNH05665.1 FAD/NAD(P)-binding protein [Cellulomonas fimi]VEH25903.1 Uncharacterized protein conserved in bacteria [Cellulomonas fimi]